MKRNVIYILILLSFMSCQNNLTTQDTKSFNAIWIHANPVYDPLTFEFITDSVFVIPLEFTEEFALSRIQKVRIWENGIFVMDEMLEEIFVFDLTGKFLQKFNSYGKAMGEVVSVSDMEVDPNRKFLLVLSDSTKSINRYKLDDLSFVDQIELPFYPSSFAISKDNDYLAFQVGYYNQHNNNFHISDMKGKIIYSGFKFPTDIYAHDLSNLTGGVKPGEKDFFLYSDALSNEINEISSERKVNNRYEFFFDSNWPKSDQYAFERFTSSLNEGLFNFLGPRFLEAGDYLMFTYNLALSDKVKNFAPRKGYLNLNWHKVITQEHFPSSDFIQGLSGPLGTYNDFFITAFYPSRLLIRMRTTNRIL